MTDPTHALAAALHDSYLRDPSMPRIVWTDLNDAERAMWKHHAAAILAALDAALAREARPDPLVLADALGHAFGGDLLWPDGDAAIDADELLPYVEHAYRRLDDPDAI